MSAPSADVRPGRRLFRRVPIEPILFFLSLFYLFPFLLEIFNFIDEGWLLRLATRILHGQVMYRDFTFFLTPGTPYILAILFKLFGATFLVARLFIWIVAAADTVLIYGIAST